MENEKRSSVSPLVAMFGVAIVLLAPLVVYVLLRSSERGPGVSGAEPPAATATEAARKKNVIPWLESDQPRPKVAVRKPEPAPLPPVRPPQKPAAPEFPLSKDVPLGMEKTRLFEAFGRPNMATTEVSEGRPLETLRYLRPETGMETVIQLRSGRVVGATSAAY